MPAPRLSVGPVRRPDAQDRPTDLVIAELAAGQHGRVASWQLAAAGVTPTEIRRRVLSGHLHRERRGVLAVGHPGSSPDAHHMSAVLACGPWALLAERSLAHHLGLLDGPPPLTVDVLAAGRTRVRVPGVRLHLPRRISRAETTRVRGIPCTTVERMLVDVAAQATDAELATLVHRAEVRGLVRRGPMRQQLKRRVAGVGRVRGLVTPQAKDLRRELEQRFARFHRAGGWPPYEANALLVTPLGTLRPDALWRAHGFGLELDSWTHHGERDAFEGDRRRVVVADLAGMDLKRVTWRMLTGSPDLLAALLDHRLGRSRARR